MLASLYHHRRFIARRAIAELHNRYAGTGAGVMYNVLHPLAIIALYAIVFSGIMSTELPELPGRFGYTLYLCAALLPWMAFSDCIVMSTRSLTANAQYLKKLPIPEPVFVAQTALATTIGLSVSFALLLLGAVLLGHGPKTTWLLVPIPLLMMQTLAFAAGLILATINVFLRDVGEWTGIALQLIFWTAPIVYPASILPDWAARILPWHPLVPAMQGLRELLLMGAIPTWSTWLGMLAWPMVMLSLASLVLRKLAWEIRDVL